MVISTADRGRDVANVRPRDTERTLSMLNQSTTRIPLTRGRYALVDSADYSRLVHLSWHLSNGGCAESQFRGTHKAIYMHRLIMDAPPGVEVDHINGDQLDNRRENLRLVTHSQNQQNRRGATRKSRSGIRGVWWHGLTGKYAAGVRVKGKHIHLGLFGTAEEADRAARAGRRQYMTHSKEAERVLRR